MGTLGTARKRRILRVLALCAVAIGVIVTLASAAGPGGWDHLGDRGTPGTDSLDLVASALAVTPGALYVGGEFTDAGGIPNADRIAKWNGSSWSAVSSSASQIPDGRVSAIAVSGGKVYAGGSFHNAGGDASADFLAVWDGVSWKPFCDTVAPSGVAFDGNVTSLQIVGQTLYVGGEFHDGGGILAADYLLACDLATGASHDTVGNPAHPFSSSVYALTADSNGTLYAGGGFINLEDNSAADGVARLPSGGSSWQPMDAGVPTFVRGLTAVGTDVYVGTDADDIAGISQADHVAKWNGSEWSALGADSGGDDGWFPPATSINALAGTGSYVFATGTFQDANGDQRADHIAFFDGTQWHPVGSNGAGDGPWSGNGLALALVDKQLYAAGSFTSAGGDPQAHSVASFSLTQIIAYPTPTVTPGPSAVPTPTVTPAPAPETTITSGPAEGSSISDSTPTFEFVSSDPGAYFVCTMSPQVDPNGIGVCTSPLTQPELSDRSYEFVVYSQGAALVETSPEHRTFTVDTIDPKARLSGPLTQTADAAIGVTVSCGAEACKVVASGSVSVPGAARLFRLRTVKRAVAAKHRARLKLRVPAKAQRAIRAALRHDREVAARIRVKVADKAGNTRIKHRRVKLRR